MAQTSLTKSKWGAAKACRASQLYVVVPEVNYVLMLSLGDVSALDSVG
jgi:hypothetical protein